MNLRISVCTEKELEPRYYPCYCDDCGWFGSSRLLVLESGMEDSDIYCPRCDSSEINDCGLDISLYRWIRFRIKYLRYKFESWNHGIMESWSYEVMFFN